MHGPNSHQKANSSRGIQTEENIYDWSISSDARVGGLAILREKRTVLAQRFDELKQSSNAGWEKVKASLQSALDDVQKAYENAKASIRS